MNDQILKRILGGGLLVILVGVVLHAPISVYFGTLLPDYALAIKAWKELLMLLLIIPASVLATRHKLWPHLWKSTLLRLCVAYIVLHFVLLAVFHADVQATVAGLMIDLRFMAFFLLWYLYGLVEPKATVQSVKALIGGGVIIVGFGLLQITVLPDAILTYIGYGTDTISPYSTIDKNPDFVRINSTLRGPNPLGAVMVILLAFVASWAIAKRQSLSRKEYTVVVLLSAAIIAVLFASYSRSAYLGAAAALAVLGVISIRKINRKWLYTGIAASVVAATALFFVEQTDWYANVVLHEDPESTVVKKSNDEHVKSLQASYQQALTHPLGSGVGTTGSASLYGDASRATIIENYYLFVAKESGWVGLGLFLAICGLIATRLWVLRKNWYAAALLASGAGLALIALLLPVWTDDTVALLWWGITGAVLAANTSQ